MLSRFHLIPERNGRTERQTDGEICYINIACQYADARYAKRAIIKTGPLQLIFHNFTNSQRSDIIFGVEIPYSILYYCNKKIKLA